MAVYKIAVLPGDGIGPEIIDGAVSVLKEVSKKFDVLFGFETAAIGGCAIGEYGVPLPESTVALCKASDAVLLGAVGGPKWDTLSGDKRPEAGLLSIRAQLNLYANLRPAIVYHALSEASPLKPEILGNRLDILVVRELTGGIYFGERGRVKNDAGDDAAFDTECYSVPEIDRIARLAFKIARRRSSLVTSVDKANVLESSRLWREVMTDVSHEYPDVQLTHMYVDNAAMQLIRKPTQFDVIVTGNMFGDILSDEASMITGSIGMLPSASLSGGIFGLYEPIHGSAPDIAGKGIANPLATILSAAMMLRYSFGLTDAAHCIEKAVESALNDGCRTADIAHGEPYLGTVEMTREIVKRL